MDIEPTRLELDTASRRAVVSAGVGDPIARRGEIAKAMIELYESELAQKPDVPRGARLHYEIGRLLESVVGDLDGASKHYQLAHELSREHLPTLRGARRVFIAQKKPQKALPMFDAEVRLTSDPQRKAMLLYEKGLLQEDQLGLHKEALATLSAALDLDASNLTILKALERAVSRLGAWDALSETLERQANAVSSDPKHRAVLIAERARLLNAKSKQPEAAIELYQTALGIDARAAGVLPALKSLLYTHRRWRDLIGVLEHEAEQTADPEARAMARYSIGRLHADRLGNLDEALTAFEAAAAELPADTMILEELARLYERAKRWDKLARTLEALAQKVSVPTQQIGLFHQIGQIYEDRMDDEGRALEWYRRALDADPAYLPASQALAKLYTRREQWQSLISMHLAEADTAPEKTRRAASYARVADILERRLGNVDQAMEQHARALALVPGYAASFKALARLYSQTARNRELAELYERAVDEADDDETKITYLFKIGRLHEDALGAPQAAVQSYRRILQIQPMHLGAVHAWQRAAERAERWDDLIAALEYEAQKTTKRSDKVALLHRAGEIAEDIIGDQDGALSRYRQVIEADSSYVPALSSLGRLYYRAGRWDDLLATYQLELKVTPKGPQSAALLFKMAELTESRIGKEDDAIRYYRQAIEADPKHVPALRALVRLLTAKADWPEVVRLLEAEQRTLEDPAERARAAFHVGEVYENRLNIAEKALVAYDQALSAASDFRPALDAKMRLLEQKKDYKALAEAMRRQAEATKEPVMAVAARMREGEILRDNLDAPKEAAEAFESVLQRDPNHLGALVALESLYGASAQWEKLAQTYAAEARILQNGFARAAALREHARLQETNRVEGQGPEDLTQAYLSVVRISPSDSSALAALERLGLEQKDWTLLSHVDAKLGSLPEDPTLLSAYQTRLAETLEASGDMPSALDSYRAALARDPENIAAARGFGRVSESFSDPQLLSEAANYEAKVLRNLDRASDLLLRSARVRAEQQSDVVGAAAELERALDLNPDHQASAAYLSNLLASGADLGRLTDILTRAASGAKNVDRRAALWVMVAELYATRGNNVGAALAALARAVKEAPKYVPALMKQADLFARDSQWNEASQALTNVLASNPPADMATAANLQLAWLLHKHLGDSTKARKHLDGILKSDVTHRGALALLVEVQLAQKQEQAAAETAARLVAVSTDGTDKADAVMKLGLLERQRGRRAEAAQAFKQAIAVLGNQGDAINEFRTLLADQKKHGERPSYREYAEGLATFLDRIQTPGRALAPVFVELGRVLDDELKQTDRGLATLRRGLELTGEDPDLRMELAKRLERAGKPQEALEQLRKILETDAMRVETWQKLVEIFRTLGRADLATHAAEPLVAIGGGTDLDRVTVQSRATRPAALPEAALVGENLRALDAGGPEDHTTNELLAALSPMLSKIQPANIEAYGLSARDRITSRSGHPLRVLADRVARIYGVPAFELYVHQAHAGGIEVEFTDEPAIMVPTHVTKLTESQQAFVIARAMTNIARGVYAVDKLPPQQILLLLTAATRLVEPTFGSGQADEETLNSMTRRVQKALPWLGSRPVEDAGKAYAPSPKPRLDDWLLRIRMTATRAATLVSDDLPGAIQFMRRTEGDLARIDAGAVKRGMAVIADAMRFSVSDAAATIRRRLGTS